MVTAQHELHQSPVLRNGRAVSPSGESNWSNSPRNAKAFIDNPFIDTDPIDLKESVKQFVQNNGLDDHLDRFEKAALLARDSGVISSGFDFTPFERRIIEPVVDGSSQGRITNFRAFARALRREPKQLQVIMLACALAAVVQGWDQSSINGANLRWPADLRWRSDIMAPALDADNASARWYFGFVNAAPFLFASLIGTWFSDPLNEYLFGRRPAIFFAAVFCLISVVGSSCVRTVGELLACRILLGIGIGAKASVVPVYAAEVAPAYMRGSLVMCWQFFVALGILLGYSMNLAVFNIRELNWRLQLASAALPAISLAIIIFACPESPRFLIKKREFEAAYKSLRAITKHDIIAAKELLVIQAQIAAEAKLLSSKKSSRNTAVSSTVFGDEINPYVAQNATSYWRRAIRLVTIPRIGRASLAAFVVMISQQLCGVNLISFYSATIFSGNVKYQDIDGWNEARRYSAWTKGLWMSWGTGAANFLFAIPAFGTIDRRGRRALLLWTIPGLMVTLVAAALSFLIRTDRARDPVLAVILVLYMAFYSPGLGPVPFTYSAEVFPLISRELGMSWAVFVNLFGAGILSLTVPILNNAIGSLGLLFLFAGLNVVAYVLVFCFVYETKQVSLEKLNLTFDIWVRRNLLRRQVDRLPPLHMYAKQKI